MSMTAKLPILVVEDEAAIRTGVCDVLAFHGHAPTGVASGEDGLRQALAGPCALVVLDVMLPGMSGFDVCRELRTRRPELAILMLTARGAEADVLEGFRCGADDYVTKPFSVSELVARIEALLRRSGPRLPPPPEPFEFAAWRVDPDARTASCRHATVALTSREVALLALLARERGRIVSRRRLLVEVWGMRHVERIHTRTVDMHIAKLRKKIDSHAPAAIETVRGEGYRFVG
jgi:two-component system response regulator RegX3